MDGNHIQRFGEKGRKPPRSSNTYGSLPTLMWNRHKPSCETHSEAIVGGGKMFPDCRV